MIGDMNGEVDNLAEYDAETARLVGSAEADAQAADLEYERAKASALDAKKRAEAAVSVLRALIRDRAAGRGAKPEPSLLDFAKPAAEWRGRPLSVLSLGPRVARALEGINTLGELYDQISTIDPTAGVPFGLLLTDVLDLRAEVQRHIDGEAQATAEATPDPAIPADIWRQYPLSRWERFGVTAKDLEKLAAGEIKRETGRRPLVTVGDLSDFSTPTASGYSRGYADVKGIGTAGGDRISEAELRFWAWWNGGGEAEFAAEMGATNGAQATSEVPELADNGRRGSV